jgi:hypothetical protein
LPPFHSTLTRAALAAASVLTCAAALAPCASAFDPVPDVPIASIANQGRISAQSGWVAWSAPAATGGYALTTWHEGATTTRPVSAGPLPFDLDLGTDAAGRVVATFPRCQTESANLNGLWTPPTGCRIHAVDLVTGVETTLPIPTAKGASDTEGSMSGGKVAVARVDAKHPRVAQVLLWSPPSKKLTALPGGAMPKGKTNQQAGQVDGLDLGANLASFLFIPTGDHAYGEPSFQVRADRLVHPKGALVGWGFVGEACGGAVDSTVPSAPTSVGRQVVYAQLSSNCYAYTSKVKRYGAFPVSGMIGTLPGTVLQLTSDGEWLYELLAPPNKVGSDPADCTAEAPCTIAPVRQPALHPIKRLPTIPSLD